MQTGTFAEHLPLSDTDDDILRSFPSPGEILGGGFTHTPPNMVDYLTVTEKQEDQWFQIEQRYYVFYSK